MLNVDDNPLLPAAPRPGDAPAALPRAPEGGNPDLRRLPAPERHVTVSPLDMRQARFGSAMRGFDKAEVTSFLEEAASDYDAALRENERLRQQVAGLESAIIQYREVEGSLKTTLMNAQRVADDMRENARLEAARIIREAEGHAALLLEKTQARVEDIQREIDGLRLKRREVQGNLEGCISALQSTIDFIQEQEQREREARWGQTPTVPHSRAVGV
jgi:cell division initiation protein